MTRYLRPAAHRGGHPLAGLRPADPEWAPAWRRGPVDPRFDPSGAPPERGPRYLTAVNGGLNHADA